MHNDSWPANAIAAVTHHDPYPYYAALAAHRAPCHDEQLRLWVVAHPDTVRDVLMHPLCRVRPGHEPVPATLAGPAGRLFGALVRMNDGDRHVAPKAVLRQALQALPPTVAAEHATAIARRLAGEVHDAATLNAFVAGAPVQAVASLLGFAQDDLPAVAASVARYVACLSPLASEREIALAHEAANALLDALRGLSRRASAHGLLADVAAAAWPDEHTLLANLAGLMTQTYEATAGLLGNCIVARLRGDAADTADTVDAATLVATVMARDPAIQNTRRFAAGDIEVAGMHVPAGQALLLVLAGAAGFGHGRHACPGQALAQCIVIQALQALQAMGPLPAVGWRYRPSVNARLPIFTEESES